MASGCGRGAVRLSDQSPRAETELIMRDLSTCIILRYGFVRKRLRNRCENEARMKHHAYIIRFFFSSLVHLNTSTSVQVAVAGSGRVRVSHYTLRLFLSLSVARSCAVC